MQPQMRVGDMRKFAQENDHLKQQSAYLMSQAAATATQRQMEASMSVMAAKVRSANTVKTSLLDVKGLGKPGVVGNSHEDWTKWSRAFELQLSPVGRVRRS